MASAQKTSGNKRAEARRKLFSEIIRAVGPVIKKYGKENVRLAMNFWNNVEREKKNLQATVAAAQKELKNLADL